MLGAGRSVHTTQFAIREPRFGLFQHVLELAAEELKRENQALFALVASVV